MALLEEAQRRQNAAEAMLHDTRSDSLPNRSRITESVLAYLLDLSDGLRGLGDPGAIQAEACRKLGEHLGASRVLFAEVVDEKEYLVDAQFTCGVQPIRPGRYPLASYAGTWRLAEYKNGRPIVVEDHSTDPRVTPDRERFAAYEIMSSVSVPLLRDGRCVAVLGTHMARPRSFSAADVTAVEETAARTWAAVEQSRAERALRASEEKYRSLIETMKEGFALCEIVRDVEGRACDLRLLEMNAAFEKLTQKTVASCVGRLRSEVFAERASGVVEIAARVAASGQAIGPIEAQPSANRWYEGLFYPRPDDRVAIFYSDISARKLAERESREREERQRFLLGLSDALRAAADAHEIVAITAERLGRHLKVARCLYVGTDESGEWLAINGDWTDGSVEHLRGRFHVSDFGDLLGQLHNWATVIVSDTLDDARTAGAQSTYARMGGIRAFIGAPLVRNGRLVAGFGVHHTEPRRWTDAEIALVAEVADRTWSAIEHAHAEAALKQSEQRALTLLAEARAARAQAEASNRAKDQFLATVSHELRTPLAAISLWTATLRSPHVSAAHLQRAVDAIAQSAENQSRLVEDLLDLSRLVTGSFTLSKSSVDVGEVGRAAVSVVQPLAAERNVELRTEIEPGLGSCVLDRARLQQILWNLLVNGTKFTPPGGCVTLRMRTLDGVLDIEVADTGDGIASEFLPHVFEPFRQADMGLTRKHMGLGIGLTLARQLTELHSGSIVAESAGIGHGAVFRVRIPRLEPNAEEGGKWQISDTIRSAPLDELRVLLVEDDPLTREGMECMLAEAGAIVTAVEDATQALRALEHEDAMQVIVSDLGLPGTSGYELIELVAAECERRGRPVPPACAVSAHARDADRRRALAAGFDVYLTKPVSAEHLVEAVAHLRHTLPGSKTGPQSRSE
ncbi:MAG: GAF domain-containing protein [Myxococcota bacterium]